MDDILKLAKSVLLVDYSFSINDIMYVKLLAECLVCRCSIHVNYPQYRPPSLVAQMVKASVYNVVDLDSIPGLGRSPGEGNGNALQYSCLENPMDRGAC